MRKLTYLLGLFLICFQTYGCSRSADITKYETLSEKDTVPEAQNMKIKITVGNKTAIANLYNNPTSKDFIKLLPMTVKMDDYSNTEKIFYPSTKLSTEGAPSGFDPSVGDLTLYAPWGNVALFYKDFGYSKGLISLGKITDGIEIFTTAGSITAKFELVEE